ncbi:hypothetical protein F5148DRAFT_1148427 [Russula earlei]|uniref:Uncharacterized protein n=1 Tax=Russula earlei TaxID=71964 RepID=A0ACC0UD53_9AGAM|nr:hypothetical protein F5148DRAFT_1148427 [Russula earlei]
MDRNTEAPQLRLPRRSQATAYKFVFLIRFAAMRRVTAVCVNGCERYVQSTMSMINIETDVLRVDVLSLMRLFWTLESLELTCYTCTYWERGKERATLGRSSIPLMGRLKSVDGFRTAQRSASNNLVEVIQVFLYFRCMESVPVHSKDSEARVGWASGYLTMLAWRTPERKTRQNKFKEWNAGGSVRAFSGGLLGPPQEPSAFKPKRAELGDCWATDLRAVTSTVVGSF